MSDIYTFYVQLASGVSERIKEVVMRLLGQLESCIGHEDHGKRSDFSVYTGSSGKTKRGTGIGKVHYLFILFCYLINLKASQQSTKVKKFVPKLLFRDRRTASMRANNKKIYYIHGCAF